MGRFSQAVGSVPKNGQLTEDLDHYFHVVLECTICHGGLGFRLDILVGCTDCGGHGLAVDIVLGRASLGDGSEGCLDLALSCVRCH